MYDRSRNHSNGASFVIDRRYITAPMRGSLGEDQLVMKCLERMVIKSVRCH